MKHARDAKNDWKEFLLIYSSKGKKGDLKNNFHMQTLYFS